MVTTLDALLLALPADLRGDVATIARLAGKNERDTVVEMLRGAVTLWRREAPSAQLLAHDGPPTTLQLEQLVLGYLRTVGKPLRRRDLQARLEQDLGSSVPWWRLRNAVARLVKHDLARRRPNWRYESVPLTED